MTNRVKETRQILQGDNDMTENFIASLRVMGLGMLGIFVVAVVLMLIMILLTKIFPAKNGGEGEMMAENTENMESAESSKEA